MSNSPRTIRRDTRVFISAVTRELGSVRKLVKKGLEDNDYHAVEQDNFPPDYRDLMDKLRERIDSCDAVVHIAGHCYGAEPTERPADAPRRSYTQLEYDIAVELGKPVYVFLTGDDFPADPHEPEPPELQELQAAHRQRLTSTGQDYNPTASIQQLDQKIRSLQLKVERLTEEIQQVDQKMDVHGGRLRRWLVGVAVLVIAALGTVGLRRLAATGRTSGRAARTGEAAGERDKQERERMAAEAARKEAQTIEQVQQEFAERFLQQLLTNKEIKAEDARQRALKELPALVKLPLAEIQSLIDRKIAPRPPRRVCLLSSGRERRWPRGTTTRCSRRRTIRSSRAASWRCWKGQQPWPGSVSRRNRNGTRAPSPRSSGPWPWPTRIPRRSGKPGPTLRSRPASVLHDLARYAEAEPLLRECLATPRSQERARLPGVAVVLNNLAQLLQATNRLSEAEPLYRRALAIDEKSYGPDHPNVAIRPQQPGAVAPGHESPVGGRAALSPRAGDRRAVVRPRPPQRRDRPQQPGAVAPGHESPVGGRAALSPRAWPSTRNRTAPTTPTSRSDLNNLASLLQATNRLAEAEPLMARAVRILSRFQRSTGHEHPNLRGGDVENYRQLLSELKLAEPEIASADQGGERRGRTSCRRSSPRWSDSSARPNRSRTC